MIEAGIDLEARENTRSATAFNKMVSQSHTRVEMLELMREAGANIHA
jgi:hypothetical protein